MLPANLPTSTPAEALAISPESLEVANCYLQNPNIDEVCQSLDMPRDVIASILDKREVKAYIDSVFFNTGFNNKFQMRGLMDTIIKKKLQELDEAEISTSKDITEILALSHKMTMEHMAAEIALEKLRAANAPKVQTNIQINENTTNNALGGTKYGDLITQLLKQSQTTAETIDV